MRSAFEIISGPLSQRTFCGMPCRHVASAGASITPGLLMRRATFRAGHTRLRSSIDVRTRGFRPSWVCACTKSKFQTWLRWRGRSLTQDPSFSHRWLRDLQPLATPDPLNPIRAHPPAGCLQQRGDAAEYGAEYARAADCLIEDREALLAFFDMPAEHWDHRRTINPIESAFATVRHRTVRTKGALSPITSKPMVFKLVMAAAKTWQLKTRRRKTWRRLKGENQLPKVVPRVILSDGTEVIACPDHRAV